MISLSNFIFIVFHNFLLFSTHNRYVLPPMSAYHVEIGGVEAKKFHIIVLVNRFKLYLRLYQLTF
jgi:hypothetical protein